LRQSDGQGCPSYGCNFGQASETLGFWIPACAGKTKRTCEANDVGKGSDIFRKFTIQLPRIKKAV
ncbi:hypothetical protein, partial [Bergeriella denitrificans]|uniref:hypothetical protein n=1 Tax=Bergeriella denitrificans TaxID=494 RepID=UPI001C3F5154